jgi:hypothetical protein
VRTAGVLLAGGLDRPGDRNGSLADGAMTIWGREFAAAGACERRQLALGPNRLPDAGGPVGQAQEVQELHE